MFGVDTQSDASTGVQSDSGTFISLSFLPFVLLANSTGPNMTGLNSFVRLRAPAACCESPHTMQLAITNHPMCLQCEASVWREMVS